MAYVRTVKTASGATAVQIVHSTRRSARKIEHLGSAHNEQGRGGPQGRRSAAARAGRGRGRPRCRRGRFLGRAVGDHLHEDGHLWDALYRAYVALGFEDATDGDPVFRDLVLARIVEPTSKLDSLRFLEEVGVATVSYPTLNRRLGSYPEQSWRERLAAACAARATLGPASLVLYDVSTLYFETHEGDGFCEPGFSKERRLEPQITIGLLTDATGFSLMLQAFEGNKAETKTMLPTITSFMAAHHLAGVTSSRTPGWCPRPTVRRSRTPSCRSSSGPDPRGAVPGQEVAPGPSRAGHRRWAGLHPALASDPGAEGGRRRDKVTYYRYKADSARRTLHGIDIQIAKAERAVAGKEPVNRNRFVKLAGGDKTVNRDLEAKARVVAGVKACITNMTDPSPWFVVAAYHQLWHIEKSCRMSKHDLQARPIYHRKRDSIEAHLNVVFAALAITRLIEDRTGWSIKKFVRTTRRYRTVQMRAGNQDLTAEDPYHRIYATCSRSSTDPALHTNLI